MEQQTLSIAKAGIICQLNARTSILAAANPSESQWNKNKTIVENIMLPHTLMSRWVDSRIGNCAYTGCYTSNWPACVAKARKDFVSFGFWQPKCTLFQKMLEIRSLWINTFLCTCYHVQVHLTQNGDFSSLSSVWNVVPPEQRGTNCQQRFTASTFSGFVSLWFLSWWGYLKGKVYESNYHTFIWTVAEHSKRCWDYQITVLHKAYWSC